jgi:hypothetical protein
MRKPPKNFQADGQVDTCIHAMIMANRVRLQINAENVLYAKDSKQVKQLSMWLLRASKYLEQQEKLERAWQRKWGRNG